MFSADLNNYITSEPGVLHSKYYTFSGVSWSNDCNPYSQHIHTFTGSYTTEYFFLWGHIDVLKDSRRMRNLNALRAAIHIRQKNTCAYTLLLSEIIARVTTIFRTRCLLMCTCYEKHNLSIVIFLISVEKKNYILCTHL